MIMCVAVHSSWQSYLCRKESFMPHNDNVRSRLIHWSNNSNQRTTTIITRQQEIHVQMYHESQLLIVIITWIDIYCHCYIHNNHRHSSSSSWRSDIAESWWAKLTTKARSSTQLSSSWLQDRLLLLLPLLQQQSIDTTTITTTCNY